MKNLLLVSILTLTSLNLWAKDSERVILTDAKTFATEVSNTTVRCSDIGYGNLQLKINLPGLDGWTLFDHSNANLGDILEPCMTAGRCSQGHNIDDLVKNNPGLETVTVVRKIVEVKMEAKDANNGDVCRRLLREELQTTVRGFEFHHTRTGLDQDFPIEVCRK
jgi:hypothetical protein